MPWQPAASAQAAAVSGRGSSAPRELRKTATLLTLTLSRVTTDPPQKQLTRLTRGRRRRSAACLARFAPHHRFPPRAVAPFVAMLRYHASGEPIGGVGFHINGQRLVA